MLQVKVKKLNPEAVIPTAATDGSAGLDLVATSESLTLDYIEYGTSIALELPANYMALIFPRSSISSNTTMIMANSVGVIDSDYVGEVKVRFKNLREYGVRRYKVGDKIAQLLILPIPKVEITEVSELKETKRGDGGHGSTGK